MSEYQYYEFAAIDQPLTRAEVEVRRQKRETELRRIMGTPEKYWQAASELASRGSASGYEKAVNILKVLAEGYALVAGSEAFDRPLRRFLVPHATRAALLRRLTEAGLWSG